MSLSMRNKLIFITVILCVVAVFSGGFLVWGLWDITSIVNRVNESSVVSAINKRLYQLKVVIVLTAMAVMIIGLVYIFGILKRLSNVFSELKNVTEGFTAGEFREVNIKGDDEFSELGRVYNATIRNLSSAIKTVQDAVKRITLEASQLTKAVSHIHDIVERQNVQAEQVSSATMEMSQTLIEVSKNAASTTEAAKGTKALIIESDLSIKNIIDKVNELASVVEGAIRTVMGLNAKMTEINKTLDVIKDIADQTNLLSLNAAIEAARAGEQGRGFAVVAEEVRKLADRSARSAEQIAKMISSINEETSRTVKETEEVHKVVQDVMEETRLAKENLKAVIQAAENTLDMSSRISAATEENSSAVEQISQSMEALAETGRLLFEEMERLKKAAVHLEILAKDMAIAEVEEIPKKEEDSFMETKLIESTETVSGNGEEGV